jgi:hypothetical protein
LPGPLNRNLNKRLRAFSCSVTLAAAGLCSWPAPIAGQAPGRLATTAEALVGAPLFYHGKQIVIRHAITETPRVTRLENTSKPVYVFWKDRPARSNGEIRGEFWDLGRIVDGDGRFTTIDFGPVLEEASNGRWPGRDQVFVILGASLVDSTPPGAASVRSLALSPQPYDAKQVTLTGRFRGRNLYGDLPQGLGKSRWDFVLQSADGAVWVSGLRPKGKDFDLDPAARVDTGRWLEVTGTVHVEGPVVWIAGESLRQTSAPADPVTIAVPAEPAPIPKVIFTAPVPDETDVAVSVVVRLQFSWDMNNKTFTDHVRIRYTGRNAPAVPPPPFTLTYHDVNRSLEIRFKQPLERFQMLTIDLLEGITAAGGGVLAPWSLTFTTGG